MVALGLHSLSLRSATLGAAIGPPLLRLGVPRRHHLGNGTHSYPSLSKPQSHSTFASLLPGKDTRRSPACCNVKIWLHSVAIIEPLMSEAARGPLLRLVIATGTTSATAPLLTRHSKPLKTHRQINPQSLHGKHTHTHSSDDSQRLLELQCHVGLQNNHAKQNTH